MSAMVAARSRTDGLVGNRRRSFSEAARRGGTDWTQTVRSVGVVDESDGGPPAGPRRRERRRVISTIAHIASDNSIGPYPYTASPFEAIVRAFPRIRFRIEHLGWLTSADPRAEQA